jgi:hypothetical protein
MALKEEDHHRVIFVKSREEGGINWIYNPESDSSHFQVFIHKLLPYREVESHEFASFPEARSFASRRFHDWEFLAWDLKTKRPCEEGGKECGSGECDTCKQIKAEGGEIPQEIAHSGCGSCGGA